MMDSEAWCFSLPSLVRIEQTFADERALKD